MSPKPKYEMSWLSTDVDLGRPFLSYRERTVHHLIRGSYFDIGLGRKGQIYFVSILTSNIIYLSGKNKFLTLE